MNCIYHSRDLDGFASAAIVKLKYPEAKLIGFDYGEKLPYDKIPPNEPIIMVDVSLPMPEMLALAKHSNYKLTWIDHHLSAIKAYQSYSANEKIFAVLENGVAACEGTWKHLFPYKEIPLTIKLLSQYDTWQNSDKLKWETAILPFQFGFRVICNSPETFPLDYLQESSTFEINRIAEVIAAGRTILNYQAQTNRLLCKKASFEYTFEGLRAICLNGGGFNSDVFKSVYDESKHDLMMPFQFDGKQWVISLYATKNEIDCSVIAKKHGGGGHKFASGFQVTDIKTIFNII